VFNLCESFNGDDTADFKIAAYLELIGKKYTGSGTTADARAGQGDCEEDLRLPRHPHADVRQVLSAAVSISLTTSSSRHRQAGARGRSIGIEFSAVVNSIRELMERMDWLHANFDSPVLIEEYIDGREMYVGVIGNDNPRRLPVVELDLSKLPDGTPRIAVAEVKWGRARRRIATPSRRSRRT
jgi:D-alanine-D-alanine ligase